MNEEFESMNPSETAGGAMPNTPPKDAVILAGVAHLLGLLTGWIGGLVNLALYQTQKKDLHPFAQFNLLQCAIFQIGCSLLFVAVFVFAILNWFCVFGGIFGGGFLTAALNSSGAGDASLLGMLPALYTPFGFILHFVFVGSLFLLGITRLILLIIGSIQTFYGKEFSYPIAGKRARRILAASK